MCVEEKREIGRYADNQRQTEIDLERQAERQIPIERETERQTER